MATAWVTELREITGMAGGQSLQAVKMPPVAEQVITFTTAAASAAFNADTRCIRVYCDANAHIRFSAAGTAATVSNCPVSSRVACFFGVTRGDKVSIIAAV